MTDQPTPNNTNASTDETTVITPPPAAPAEVDPNVPVAPPPVDPSPEEIGSPVKAVEEIGKRIADSVAQPEREAEKQMPTAPINTDIDPLKGLDPVHHADVMPSHTAADSDTIAEEITGDPHADHAEDLAPTSTLLGRSIPYPLYTAIFFVLAALTAIEVAITVLIPDAEAESPVLLQVLAAVATISLIVISLGKAVMVVGYYMHLRRDSRLFIIALALPLFIGLVSALFLLSVPITGYGDTVY